MLKIVGVFFIFVFATNAALASTVRHNLRILSKIHYIGKKRASKIITMDDPTTNDDFKVVFHSVKHCTKRLHGPPISAITTNHSMVIPLDSVSIVPINTFQPYSNNLSDIFIPPRASS